MKNLFKTTFKIFLGIFLAILVSRNMWGQDNCTISIFPYIEDLSDYTKVINCWSIYDSDDDGKNWGISIYDDDTVFISKSYDSGALNPCNYLFSPHFVIPDDGHNYIFSWYSKLGSLSWPDKYSVIVICENQIYNSNGEIITRLSECPLYKHRNELSNEWEQNYISLQQFAGKTIYIAFIHWNSYNQWSLMIDDISITKDWPLPITLLEFSVEPRYDHQTGVHVLNLLTIRTGYEYNNCEFIVYRSEDAINWDYDNPVCDWDFGQDSAIYNEALDTVLNYFTIEHPNGQTYYPVDTIPYPVTYYKLIQRDCDNTYTEYYESEIIVCIANQQKRLIEPYVICNNGPQVVGGSEVCEVFVQNVLGQVVEKFQLQPYQQREVLAEIQGMYLITFIYNYNEETRKKTEKVVCW